MCVFMRVSDCLFVLVCLRLSIFVCMNKCKCPKYAHKFNMCMFVEKMAQIFLIKAFYKASPNLLDRDLMY